MLSCHGQLMPTVVVFQWGIFVGVGVSLLILLYPIARPKLLFSSVQGFMVVTPTSGLTFPSAEYLEIKALDKALDVDKPSHVILNMEHLSFMDFSGIQAIKSLLAECEVNEIKLILAQGQKRVRRQLKLAHITNLIIVQTVQEAINKFTLEMTLDESRDGDGHYVVRSCMTRL
ncbi:sodium-independent sulfate anion transporter [Biomphalaria glabrata]